MYDFKSEEVGVPTDLTEEQKKKDAEVKNFDKECEAVAKRQATKRSNLVMLYGVAFGQYSTMV